MSQGLVLNLGFIHSASKLASQCVPRVCPSPIRFSSTGVMLPHCAFRWMLETQTLVLKLVCQLTYRLSHLFSTMEQTVSLAQGSLEDPLRPQTATCIWLFLSCWAPKRMVFCLGLLPAVVARHCQLSCHVVVQPLAHVSTDVLCGRQAEALLFLQSCSMSQCVKTPTHSSLSAWM